MYSLFETDSFSVTEPINTYIYDIFPFSTALAVLSSDDALRLLDPRCCCKESRIIKGVGESVTCCTALDMKNLVAVAGRDGSIKIWDIRSKNMIRNVTTDCVTSILSMASFSQFSLAAGSELTCHEASIFFWDLRKMDAQPLLKYNQSHSDDITVLKFHSESPNILLSGSTDGLVNIFNTSIAEEEDALHMTLNHGASIHHCGFLNNLDIFAISHDEKFSIYKMSTDMQDGTEEKNEVHFGDMRKILGGEYVTNVVGRPNGDAVVGIGSQSGETFGLVQLKRSPTWNFVPEERVTLNRAHGSDIVRSFCFFDELKIVFTGGEDGHVKAWKGK